MANNGKGVRGLGRAVFGDKSRGERAEWNEDDDAPVGTPRLWTALLMSQ